MRANWHGIVSCSPLGKKSTVSFYLHLLDSRTKDVTLEVVIMSVRHKNGVTLTCFTSAKPQLFLSRQNEKLLLNFAKICLFIIRFDKMKPMGKCLKPALFLSTSRGQQCWLQKGVHLYENQCKKDPTSHLISSFLQDGIMFIWYIMDLFRDRR